MNKSLRPFFSNQSPKSRLDVSPQPSAKTKCKNTTFPPYAKKLFLPVPPNHRIFASVNVDGFVMIATTVKNAKAIFYSTFILKSVTF